MERIKGKDTPSRHMAVKDTDVHVTTPMYWFAMVHGVNMHDLRTIGEDANSIIMDIKAETIRPRTLILPPAPYAAALVGGWWLDRNYFPLSLDWGAATRPLGWLLLGIGILLFISTLVTFWRHHTTVNPYKAATELCTSGPFRISRNPIYLGDWFFLGGISLLLNTGWPLLFAPLIWAMLRYGVIRHEEAHLEGRFGDTYRKYKSRVRRWL